MDEKKFKKIERKIRDHYRRYLKGKKFVRYCRKLTNKPTRWWDLWGWYQYQKVPIPMGELPKLVADNGELAIGLVLMRNSILSDKKAAGAVLIIASTDVTPRGFDELHAAAFKLEECKKSSDPTIRRQMGEIFDDETYHPYRCRPLPSCIPAPKHIRLHDEVMRGDDFFDAPIDGGPVTIPWALLFSLSVDEDNYSVVVPGKMGLPVLQFLIDAGANARES